MCDFFAKRACRPGNFIDVRCTDLERVLELVSGAACYDCTVELKRAMMGVHLGLGDIASRSTLSDRKAFYVVLTDRHRILVELCADEVDSVRECLQKATVQKTRRILPKHQGVLESERILTNENAVSSTLVPLPDPDEDLLLSVVGGERYLRRGRETYSFPPPKAVQLFDFLDVEEVLQIVSEIVESDDGAAFERMFFNERFSCSVSKRALCRHIGHDNVRILRVLLRSVENFVDGTAIKNISGTHPLLGGHFFDDLSPHFWSCLLVRSILDEDLCLLEAVWNARRDCMHPHLPISYGNNIRLSLYGAGVFFGSKKSTLSRLASLEQELDAEQECCCILPVDLRRPSDRLRSKKYQKLSNNSGLFEYDRREFARLFARAFPGRGVNQWTYIKKKFLMDSQKFSSENLLSFERDRELFMGALCAGRSGDSTVLGYLRNFSGEKVVMYGYMTGIEVRLGADMAPDRETYERWSRELLRMHGDKFLKCIGSMLKKYGGINPQVYELVAAL